MNKGIRHAPLDLDESLAGYLFARAGWVSQICAQTRPHFVIYEESKRGKKYAEYFLRKGIDSFVFCDVAKDGERCLGKQLIASQELLNHEYWDVVISSSRYFWDVYKLLVEFGFEKNIFLIQ